VLSTPIRTMARRAAATVLDLVPRALAAALVITGLAVVGLALPAAAHSELTSSDPKADAVLTRAPSAVTLTFGEDLRPEGAALVVTAADDTRVDQQDSLRLNGAVMSVRLEPLTEFGAYRVAYRVVSADGHPVSGEYTFTYQESEATSPAASPTPATALAASPTASDAEADSSAGRWLLAAGVVALVTVTILVITSRRRRA